MGLHRQTGAWCKRGKPALEAHGSRKRKGRAASQARRPDTRGRTRPARSKNDGTACLLAGLSPTKCSMSEFDAYDILRQRLPKFYANRGLEGRKALVQAPGLEPCLSPFQGSVLCPPCS